jgi:hypothetical protein
VPLFAAVTLVSVLGVTKSARAGTIDLVFTPPSHRVSGANAEDRAGKSVLFGDVDGDTRDDLIVAAPEFDLSGRSACGALFIVLASDTLPPTVNLDDLRPDVKRIFGPAAGSRLGAVLACGDIDGDGRSDIVCGIPTASPLGRTSAGELYVVFGNTMPADTLDLAAAATGITHILGASVFDQLGTSIAVGDVNNDNFGDIVAGAPLANTTRSLTGKAVVVSGSASLPGLIDLATTPVAVTRIFGQATNDFFGGAVFSADVTGDDIADIIVGAPESSPFGRSQAGNAYIIPGGASLADTIDTITAAALGVSQITGEAPQSATGSGFAVGDFDGDLSDDLAVGAPEFGSNHGGAVYLLAENGGWPDTLDLAGVGVIARLDGDESNANVGLRLATGDVNLDGRDDIVIGAPKAKASVGRDESGKVYVVYGRTLFPSIFSLLPPQNGVTAILGAAAQDHVGSAVACGRLDGTGAWDILVGAEQLDNPGELRAGAGLVFLGAGGLVPTAIITYDADVIDGAVHLGWNLPDPISAEALQIERAGGGGDRVRFRGDQITQMHTRDEFVDRSVSPAATYEYSVSTTDGEPRILLTIGVTVPPRAGARLAPAFPNPFATSATFSIWLPDAGHAEVVIYNAAGARVRTVESGWFPSGTITLTWDGHDATGARAPSGVYFLRLRYGPDTLNRKLLLIR